MEYPVLRRLSVSQGFGNRYDVIFPLARHNVINVFAPGHLLGEERAMPSSDDHRHVRMLLDVLDNLIGVWSLRGQQSHADKKRTILQRPFYNTQTVTVQRTIDNPGTESCRLQGRSDRYQVRRRVVVVVVDVLRP